MAGRIAAARREGALYRRVQLAESRFHGEATFARSRWQIFDQHVEVGRLPAAAAEAEVGVVVSPG